uniref:G protein-coupled receptor n=2 Tax=Acrobeloides nanus TaxID=290746 RepID=A0A914EF92_9BILA
MSFLTTYCNVVCLIGIILNAYFLIVARLRRVEGFQEVVIFMCNIAVGYILMSLCIIVVAPQSIYIGTSNVRVPYGILAHLDSSFLNAVAAFGFACYLYTVLSFCVMFLYRYNVTCKTNTMSTILSRKNIAIFLATSGLFCIIQAVLIYYSYVDPQYLRDRLNVTKDSVEDLSEAMRIQDAQYALMTTLKPSGGAGQPPPPSQHQFDEQQNLIAQHGNMANGMFMPAPRPLMNVFGTDYTRNPMMFLAYGIFTATNVIAYIVIIVASMVVACKLRERSGQVKESMSDKSRDEHKKLTTILMLDAYTPILLVLIPAANYAVCFVRHESLVFQEYLSTIVVSLIPVMFPIFTILPFPPLRETALQVLICTAWRRGPDGGGDANKEAKGNADEVGKLNEAQLKALKNMSA